jgi:hypothetical protein
MIVGLAVLGEGKWNWFHVRGGLMTVGLYGLAFQIVLSLLLVFAIDDLSSSGLWHLIGRSTGELVDISARPIGFSRALMEFYRRPFWPAFLLGFGLGASISAFAVGLFQEATAPSDYLSVGLGMHRSEVTLGAILLLGSAFLWRHGRSYFGWSIGVSLATVLGQIAFVPGTNIYLTATSWGSLAIALCLLRVVAFGIGRAWRVRFSPEQLPPDR